MIIDRVNPVIEATRLHLLSVTSFSFKVTQGSKVYALLYDDFIFGFCIHFAYVV